MTEIVRGKKLSSLPRGVFEKIPGSGIYWIRYTDAAGKKHREIGGSTVRKAENKLATKRIAKINGELPESTAKPENAVTLSDLIDSAIKHAKAQNNSAYDLEHKLERIRDGFGTRSAAAITQEEIIEWLDEEMDDREWKPASRNRYQAAWSVIYRIAMKNKKVTENPAAGIGKLQEDNSRVRFLSMEEEVKLIAKIRKTNPDMVPIFQIAIHSGMRTSESLRAVVGDYSPVTGMLTVHQRKNKRSPAVRYVPLDPIGVKAYDKLAAGKKKGDRLCTDAQGNPPRQFRYWITTAAIAEGIMDFTPHDLRHTAASRWVMAGVPIAAVSGYLGHTTAQMTMRYAHLQPENKDRAIAAMMSFYKKQAKKKD
jgi:integrase